jgi:hypothetical protein
VVSHYSYSSIKWRLGIQAEPAFLCQIWLGGVKYLKGLGHQFPDRISGEGKALSMGICTWRMMFLNCGCRSGSHRGSRSRFSIAVGIKTGFGPMGMGFGELGTPFRKMMVNSPPETHQTLL